VHLILYQKKGAPKHKQNKQ